MGSAPFQLKEGYDAEFFETCKTAISGVYSRSVSDYVITHTLESEDWHQLELKQRTQRIASAIYTALETERLSFSDQLSQFIHALKLPLDGQSFYFLWLLDIVKIELEDDLHARWKAYSFLSRYVSPEFVTRSDIEEEWCNVRPILLDWAKSPHANLRRAASESSRPRLPWGIRLRGMSRNPERSIEILSMLMSDSSLYVRKSVANHWNDISKEYPNLVIEQLSKYDLTQNSTRWIVKHALRSLLKQGNSEALSLLGFFGESLISGAKLTLEQEQVTSSEPLNVKFQWCVGGNSPVKLRIDWHVTYLLKNGSYSDKSYFGSEKEWAPGKHALLWKRSFHRISTKQYYSGEHRLLVSINGKKQCALPFHLEVLPES